MPLRGGTSKRTSAARGASRFSARARVVAGGAVGLALLAALAAAELISPGHPAKAGTDASAAATASPSSDQAAGGLRRYPGGGNPNPSAHPDTLQGPAAPPVDPALTLGRANAPVTIVEFGDYQCLNCGDFARQTQPVLIHKYVDTGEVRLVWRDFPWIDAQSTAAAIAARAAAMQGKFWAYNNFLMAHQFANEHSGLVTAAYLRSVATRLGLNMTLFNRDVSDPALAAAVKADATFAQQLGVPGTPAFLIAGRPFFGAQPLTAFESAIARARRG